MTDPYFFGYGSLVNRGTHSYQNAHRARISGWRRIWRYTDGHPFATLSGVRDESSSIDGLIAEVPNGDWAALDLRETGYERHDTDAVTHPLDPATRINIYAVDAKNCVRQADERPIPLSYLDVVVRGYLTEFGETGVQDFFDTTDGWHTPILNDRAAPTYPRAQVLTPEETALVDHHIARLAPEIKQL